jgi:hypothetical protein
VKAAADSPVSSLFEPIIQNNALLTRVVGFNDGCAKKEIERLAEESDSDTVRDFANKLLEQLGEPPARATGGPVEAGKPYKVGERGEELFIPGMSW